MMGLIERREAQKRKMSALVRAMSQEDANRFLTAGHDYRREFMIANLDGCWGQTLESMMCKLVGKKLGLRD